MRIIANPFQQKSVTYCLELQIKFLYLKDFLPLSETLSDSIVYFEAEETNSIISQDEDLWQIEIYLDEQIDLHKIQTSYNEVAKKLDIPSPILQIKIVENQDWVSLVQQSFVPIEAGKFFIHSSDYVAHTPLDKISIEINAGRAFGTGEHETTMNCLKAISEISITPVRCLDMGCGSGILAIALAKLWDTEIIAVDLDEQAVIVSQANIQHNKAQNVYVGQSDGYNSELVCQHSPYQLIVANILADPLIAMAADAKLHLATGGILILAGFIDDQKESIITAHKAQGFILEKEILTQAWPALVFKTLF